jgi:hypothetical protein
MEKLAAVASKIKTPLALSGLVVVVLYAIYKQILSLDVYERIGSESTFQFLQNILDKLFWLAIIAIILGVICYLLPIILSHKARPSSSNVSLIDASLDPKDSPYKQTIKDGTKKIDPKED